MANFESFSETFDVSDGNRSVTIVGSFYGSSSYSYPYLIKLNLYYNSTSGALQGTYYCEDDDPGGTQRQFTITIDDLDYSQTYAYAVELYYVTSDPGEGAIRYNSSYDNTWHYYNPSGVTGSDSFTMPSIGNVDTLELVFESDGTGLRNMPDSIESSSTNDIFDFTIPDVTPLRKHYKFLYWTDEDNSRTLSPGQGFRIYVDGGGTYTLYAVWEESEDDGYVTAYINIKGSESSDTEAILYDSYIEKCNPSYTKYPYKFIIQIYKHTSSSTTWVKTVTIDSNTAFESDGTTKLIEDTTITGLEAATEYTYNVTVQTRVTGGWADNSNIGVVSSYTFTTRGLSGDPYVHIVCKVGSDKVEQRHKAVMWLHGLKSGEKVERWHKICVWINPNVGRNWKHSIT